MKDFAEWLAATAPSLLIQRNEKWVIPTIQSVHIMGVGIVLTCVLMMTLRLLGIAGGDRTLRQTQQRFGPWLTGALLMLLATGLVLVVAEPERELLAFSFWLKMILVACGAGLSALFQRSLQRHEPAWENVLVHQARVRVLVAAAFLIWIAIIFLGRFIAYDHIWGSLSGSTKA
jgi:drug/metabolite transporter (DMT)-like permease